MHFPFSFEIIYSRRRTVALQITRDGRVKVRAPYGCPRSFIESFLHSKEDWVVRHLEEARSHPSHEHPPLSESRRRHYVETARAIFTQKTAYYARIMGVTYYMAGGSSNFMVFTNYLQGGTQNVILAIVGMAIAFVIATVVVYFTGFTKEELEEDAKAAAAAKAA